MLMMQLLIPLVKLFSQITTNVQNDQTNQATTSGSITALNTTQAAIQQQQQTDETKESSDVGALSSAQNTTQGLVNTLNTAQTATQSQVNNLSAAQTTTQAAVGNLSTAQTAAQGQINTVQNTLNGKLNTAGGQMTGEIQLNNRDATSETNLINGVSGTNAPLGLVDVAKTWFNSVVNRLKFWDGTQAQQVATASDVSNSITNATIQSAQVSGTVDSAQIANTLATTATVNGNQVAGAVSESQIADTLSSAAIVNGNQILGAVGEAQVADTLSIGAVVSGSQINGVVSSATTATTANNLAGSATVSGSQVVGAVASATTATLATTANNLASSGSISTSQVTGLMTLISNFINAGTQVRTNENLTNPTINLANSDPEFVALNSLNGTVTVNLPSSPNSGRVFSLKDSSGNASINNITIIPSSGTIDGQPSYVINSNYGGLNLVYNNNQWLITYASNPVSAGGNNPSGTIITFAGPVCPSGYLTTNGSSVLIASYPNLAAALLNSSGIYVWGSADLTHFNIPDLRGRFLRGIDNGAGIDASSGSRTALYLGGAMGDGVGTFEGQSTAVNGMHDTGHIHGNPFGVGYLGWNNGGGGPAGALSSAQVGGIPEAVANQIPAGAANLAGDAETRPVNAAANFCVKF
jgi:hypothetical protein